MPRPDLAEVYLVDNGDDFVVVLDRLVHIGERLRLHPLRRVHHQQRAFARGEGAGDLISEIDMAGCVHEVELIRLAILRGVVQAHGLGLDGDAALLLYVHVIKDLLGHFALGQPAAMLDHTVSQRGLPMIDMRDNAEIANFG